MRGLICEDLRSYFKSLIKNRGKMLYNVEFITTHLPDIPASFEASGNCKSLQIHQEEMDSGAQFFVQVT